MPVQSARRVPNAAGDHKRKPDPAKARVARDSLDDGMADFERNAAQAAGLLKLLGNEHRLLILCRLSIAGEMSVGGLAAAVNLSQSALSQHLAKMRDDGLLTTRRDGQTIYYRIANPNAARLLAILKDIYCP